jgi:hypothetical protein
MTGSPRRFARPRRRDYIDCTMKRLHILLRVCVLAAMTLSLAESVWASACASMATMAVSDTAMSGDMPDMPDMPGMPGHGEQHDDEDRPSCPLGAAAVARGCLAAASLPATVAAPFACTEERASHVSILDTATDRIYGATPFHPPRP